MRLFIAAIVVLFVLSLAGLECIASRGASDADIPGAATDHVLPPDGGIDAPMLESARYLRESE